MKDRRQKLLDNLNLFGGLKGLIEGEDKYCVKYSEGVYELFCKKYRELT